MKSEERKQSAKISLVKEMNKAGRAKKAQTEAWRNRFRAKSKERKKARTNEKIETGWGAKSEQKVRHSRLWHFGMRNKLLGSISSVTKK